MDHVARLLIAADKRSRSTIILVSMVSVGAWYLADSLTACDRGGRVLQRLDDETRRTLFGSVAASSGALLGLIFASIAILLTLDPGRRSVARMRERDGWQQLIPALLFAAAFLGLTLIAATVGIALPSHGRYAFFDGVFLFAALAAALAFTYSVFALGLVARNAMGDDGA